MTAKIRADLYTDINTSLADNAVGSITEAILRQRLQDLADSAYLKNESELPASPGYTAPTLAAQPRATNTIFDERIRLADFNTAGVGGTDDVAIWNRAIAAAAAKGGNVSIILPETADTHLLTAPDPILANNVNFVGGRLVYGNGARLQWGNSTTPVSGGGVYRTDFVGPGTGTDILFYLPNSVLMDFTDITFSGVAGLVRMGVSGGTGVNTIRFRNPRGTGANIAAPYFDCQKGSGLFIDGGNIQGEGVAPPAFNTTSTHTANASRHLVSIAADSWDTALIEIDFLFGLNRALSIAALNGKVIQNISVRGGFLDGLKGGIVADAASGGTVSCVVISGTDYLTSWDQNGVLFSGLGSHVGHRVDRCSINSVGGHGVSFASGARGCSVSNNLIYGYSRLSAGYSGIIVDTAGQVDITDNNVNPDMSSLGFSWTAPYGINLATGCDNYICTGNKARGTASAYAIAADGGSPNRAIRNNVNANYAGKQTTGIYTSPASGATWTNTSPFDVEVVLAGTITSISRNGVGMPGVTTTSFVCPPMDSFGWTYTGGVGSAVAYFFVRP